MSSLPDDSLRNLRQLVDYPDLSGTRYELVRRLAIGGMGSLFVVRDRDLDRELALKLLTLDDPVGDLNVRLRSEARFLARLEHPGIVPVHDLGQLSDGRWFYTMKLVAGRTLEEYRREVSDRTHLLGLFDRLCETVAFAHARGVWHRDIKPANVMVGAFGELLVMDWGIAAVANEKTMTESSQSTPSGDERRTAPGTIMGTPAYMAPEQKDRTGAVDHRADIYALGGVLWFLLTGENPSPSHLTAAGDHPKRLWAVVQKAMAASPAARYQSVVALQQDIQALLADRPVSAYQDRWHEKLGRFLDRNRFVMLLVAAYIIVRFVIYLWLRY